MCGGHRHHGRRGGFPDREQWVERLRAYQAQLEAELENVKDVIGRLADAPETAEGTA